MPLQIIIETESSEKTEKPVVEGICGKCGNKLSHVRHVWVCPLKDSPTPSQDIGKNLKTTDEVRQWFAHSSNWVDTQLFIVKWDGFIPKISIHHLDRALTEKALVESVLYEQRRRKDRSHVFDVIEREKFE